MKIIATSLCSHVFPLLLLAQTYTIPCTPVLAYLYNSKVEISHISNTDKLPLFPLLIANQQASFKLIKNKTGLFALVDGTGQVYKASNLMDSNISFTRIDSTEFFGNSFGSINFSFKDTIFNLGGYGFWRYNGILSHFTSGAEWSIEKTNKSFATQNSLYCYLPHAAKLFFIDYSNMDEMGSDKKEDQSVIELDLNKKVNSVLGVLNPKINLSLNYFPINLSNLNGVMVRKLSDWYLYRFSENKVYRLINKQINELLSGRAGAELESTFEDSGKIYYTFHNDTTLKSLSISMNDFEEEVYPLFITASKFKDIWLIIPVISIISLLGIIMIFSKKKRKMDPDKEEKLDTPDTDLKSNEFNTIERALIDKLIEKSNMDSFLTVDECNTCLGIKKKTIEIQKRVRTDAINRINHKFNINFSKETVFIERIRSTEDRRFFNYIINKDNAKTYLKQKNK